MFFVLAKKRFFYSNSLSTNKVRITANGTAKITPRSHKIDHHTKTHKKISKGLTPRDLFISIGINTLFSVHWIR